MTTWDTAVMAMILASAVGFLLSDGEQRRVRWVRAMRRCLLRMSGIIRYEQPALAELLLRVELYGTAQERALTRFLHACARRMECGEELHLPLLIAQESARLSGYGVLSMQDRAAFEAVLGELGRTRLDEQLNLIAAADERLREREEALTQESGRRAQLMRTLGLASGAALFLILI